jgi:NADPH2:quinone reductase
VLIADSCLNDIEASTVPLAAFTASLAIYCVLGLPFQPYAQQATTRLGPILIYGGSSAVGAFAIKLARISNIHPIIAVAGAGREYVTSLLDVNKGDFLVDYREGLDTIEKKIGERLMSAAHGSSEGLSFALDAICQGGSSRVCATLLQKGGKLAHVLPLDEGVPLEGKVADLVMVGDIHGAFGENRQKRDFGSVMMKLFGMGLGQGWFTGHPYEVVPGGLRAIETILKDLQAGKVSAKKYVFRIADTQ